jgi:hypothetical protein
MSESAIESIYRELSKTKIGNARARNIDKVKLGVNKRDLPVRMLLPSTTGDLSFVSFGTLNRIEWVIRDLCLWAPLVSGTGVEKYAGSMVLYIKDYIAKLKTIRNPTGQSNITGVAFAMGPVPWAENDYWAVDVTLTVEEIL